MAKYGHMFAQSGTVDTRIEPTIFEEDNITFLSVKDLFDNNKINALKMLLRKRPYHFLELRNDDGLTFFHLVARDGQINYVNLILQYARDFEWRNMLVKTQDIYGKTALMYACYNGHTSIVERILKERDVDVLLTDTRGWNAIDYAKVGRHWNILEVLERFLNATGSSG